MKLVECEQCGGVNRVGGFSVRRIALCGKCRAPLPEPISIRAVRQLDRLKYWIILGLVVGGAMVTGRFREPTREPLPVAQSPARPAIAPTRLVSTFPVVPISQGVQDVYSTGERIAPLRIRTPTGTDNYYVKIVDATSGAPVMTLFVLAGQAFDTEVPLGSYRVKYATGTVWYGTERLFGPDTRFSEAARTFEFRRQGNQLSGYTIELIRQQGGNLSTTRISPEQF